MDIGIVSSRYARALLRFATEKGEQQEVYDAMEAPGKAFIDVPTLRQTLESPTLPQPTAVSLLLVAAGNPEGECVAEFLRLVVSHHRIDMMQFMARSYVEAYRKQNKLVHSKLTVPTEVSEHTIKRLRSLLADKTGDNVEFVVETDPSIIGGFIMEYDTYCYDASLRTRLQQVKRQLISD